MHNQAILPFSPFSHSINIYVPTWVNGDVIQIQNMITNYIIVIEIHLVLLLYMLVANVIGQAFQIISFFFLFFCNDLSSLF